MKFPPGHALFSKTSGRKGGAALRHGATVVTMVTLLTMLALLRVHVHRGFHAREDADFGIVHHHKHKSLVQPRRSHTAASTEDVQQANIPELEVDIEEDSREDVEQDERETSADMSSLSGAASADAHVLVRPSSSRARGRGGAGRSGGQQRSSGHSSKSAASSAGSGGSLVGRLFGYAKSSILGSLRITSSSDPKMSKKEAREDAKRIEHEAKNLAKATGKLPEGLIVELSALRGERSEVVIDGNIWPRLGLATSRSCSNRGVPQGEGRKTCLCPALFSGSQCETAVTIEKARTMVSWKGPYEENSIICAASTVSKGQEMKVARNPLGRSKEDFLPRTILKVGSTFTPNLPATDPLNGQLFRSCAVVGNGHAVLLHGARGKAIDSHSAVFRINAGPTKGYERNVGKRTTFRVTGEEPHVFGWREDLNELGFQVVRSEDDLHAFLVLKRRLRGLRLSMMQTQFVHYMDDSFNFMPSTGLYAVVMAMHRCARVDLYGFHTSGPGFREAFGSRYRYFQLGGHASDPTRDAEEWQVLQAFETAGVINFGDPCVKECHSDKMQRPCKRCIERSYKRNSMM